MVTEFWIRMPSLVIEKYFSDLIANTEKLQILCRSKPIWFSLCSSIRQLVGIYERGQ